MEFSTYILFPIFILFASHCIGDYPFQGEFLAKYKAENNFVLLVHCAIYTAIILLGFWVISFIGYCKDWNADSFAHASYVILLSHFIIDKLKCNYRKSLEKTYGDLNNEEAHKDDVFGFYADQAAHMVIILFVSILL